MLALPHRPYGSDRHTVRGHYVPASPGSGKSHLANAIGVPAIAQHGKRVRFYSTVDLVNALEQEKVQGKAGRIAANMLRLDVVISTN